MRLGESFFRRDVLEVAPALVGAYVCRRLPDGTLLRSRITETEAYRGEEDLACHARFGKTRRNAVMYLPGGHAYVYLVYGLHWLFNVIAGEEGAPQGVLIRALAPPLDGPAKWTKAFQITGAHNGLYLPHSDEIWLEQGDAYPLRSAPRVGIDYAPEPWKSKPWRFIMEREI